MRKTYFCDTSALTKLYHQELGSEWVEKVFRDKNNTIVVSESSTVEFASALAKKLRMREVTAEAVEEALSNFKKDCRERFIMSLMGRATMKRAQELIRTYGETISIRTLDALQLAACLLEVEEGLEFVCADTNLIRVAQSEGLTAVNPEVEESIGESPRRVQGTGGEQGRGR